MQIRLLGPMVIYIGHESITVTSPKERAVLAALALQAGRAVSIDEIVEVLWSAEAPRTATKAIRTHVWGLRRHLPEGSLETVPGGYRLNVPEVDVDAHVFERLASSGRRAIDHGDAPAAVEELTQALGLWGGQPLEDLADGLWGVTERRRLAELRNGCEEDLVDARLALGQHAALVGDLEAGVAAEPFRERRWGQLMLALYRCGRQAEALRAFQRVRALLSEMGIEPGVELRTLEEQILLQKSELEYSDLSRTSLVGIDLPSEGVDSFDRSRGADVLPAILTSASQRPMVGRESELARILSRLQEQDTALVIVVGEPGVGKSRLAAEVASAVHAGRTLVLYGRCDEGLGLPYQPFVEALGSYLSECSPSVVADLLGSQGRELTRLLPQLAETFPEWGRPTSAAPETERWLLFQAVAQLFRALGNARKVLVVVDDLQWTERATLLLLRHLATSEVAGLHLLCTVRSAAMEEVGPLSEVIGDIARSHRLERLTLDGLSREEIASLVGDRLARHPDRTFAEALHTETGGNPFFAHEVVSHLCDLGALGGNEWPDRATLQRVGAPEGVRHVLSRRLEKLSVAASDKLVLAAAIGDEFTTVDLSVILGIPLAATLSDLEEVAASGLIAETGAPGGGYRFAHALVRHVLYEQLSGMRRAMLHRRIADAFTSSPTVKGRLAEVAYHFRRGLEIGDPGPAVEWLWRAGDQATAQLAFEEAVEHYRTALTAFSGVNEPDLQTSGRLQLALAAASYRAGQPEGRQHAAEAAFAAARQAGDLTVMTEAALVHGGARSTYGVASDATMAMLGEAVEARADNSALDRGTLARAMSRLAQETYHIQRFEEAKRLSADAVALAGRASDSAALAATYDGRAWTLSTPDDVEELLSLSEAMTEQAVLSAEPEWETMGRIWGCSARLQLGDLDGVDTQLGRLAVLAEAAPVPSHLFRISTLRTTRALMSGDYEEGFRLAEETYALGRQAEPENAEQTFHAQLISMLREQALLGGLVAEAEQMAFKYQAVPGWRCALAFVYTEADQTDKAQELLDELAEGGFQSIPRDLAWLGAMGYLAEVIAYLGDSTRAGTLRLLLEPFADQNCSLFDIASYGAVSYYLGILAAAEGDREAARSYLQAAIGFNDRTGQRPAGARARFEAARLDSDAAPRLLADAAKTSDELGLARLRAQILALQETLDGGVFTETGLSS